MTRRELQDWLFEVDPPSPGEGGWWFAVDGAKRRSWGPYPTERDALDAAHALFRRWARAARERGGWAWKLTPRRWIVTLPRGCLADGQPFRTEACTRHTTPLDLTARGPPET